MKRKWLLVAALVSWSGAAFGQADPAARAWLPSQTAVGTSATLVADIRPNRRKIMIMTTGTNQVTCGPANTVTSGNGQPILPATAGSFIVIETSAAVWCIAASAQTVAVMENF